MCYNYYNYYYYYYYYSVCVFVCESVHVSLLVLRVYKYVFMYKYTDNLAE